MRRCCEDPDEILQRGPGMILQSLVRRSWRGDKVLVKSCLRGPCMIMYRSFTEGLVEILARFSLRGPCMKILQMPCLRGACMKALVGGSWEVLVSRSCKVLSSSSRSFYHDLMRFF